MSVGDEHDQSVADHDGPEARPLPDSEFLAFGEAGVADATQQRVADQMRSWVGAGRPVYALVEASDEVYPHGSPGLFAGALDTSYTGL